MLKGLDIKKAVGVIFHGLGSSHEVAEALNNPNKVRMLLDEASDGNVDPSTPKGRAAILKVTLESKKKLGE